MNTNMNANDFALRILGQMGHLQRFQIELEDRWLLPVAEALAALRCMVHIDFSANTLSVVRELPERELVA